MSRNGCARAGPEPRKAPHTPPLKPPPHSASSQANALSSKSSAILSTFQSRPAASSTSPAVSHV